MDIAIKNVREEDWRLLKAEAARENLKIGEFFGKLVKLYRQKEGKGNRDEILYGRKMMLTDKEAEGMREAIREFRKGFEFRKFR